MCLFGQHVVPLHIMTSGYISTQLSNVYSDALPSPIVIITISQNDHFAQTKSKNVKCKFLNVFSKVNLTLLLICLYCECMFIKSNTLTSQGVMNIPASWATIMLYFFVSYSNWMFSPHRRNARHLGEGEDPLTQCVRQGGEELIFMF